MLTKIRKIGKVALLVGILCLIISVVLAFKTETVAVPILFWLSILLNTFAVMLIRYKE